MKRVLCSLQPDTGAGKGKSGKVSATPGVSLCSLLVHLTIPFMMMMMMTTKMTPMMIVMAIVVVMINVLCLLPSYVAVSDPVCGP